MTAFAYPSLLDSRYAVIAETSAYTYDDDDLVNYAEFLQNHGRYMTKGGYVDSSRRIRSLYRQQDELQLPSQQTSSSRTGLLVSLSKSASAPLVTTTTTPRKSKKSKSSEGNEIDPSGSTTTNLENKKRDYEKQMRRIEEEMIKAKQEEREAKRLENDIKKEQRQLHYSLRDLDVDATKKRYYAEKHLSKNLQDKDKIERELIKTREKQTKERTDRIIDSLQSNKDKDRRNLLLCNDLAKQYRTKVNQLDIKHHQLDRLQTDFEDKLKQKEIEETRIKKELAEISVALNLEAQKVKSDMNDFLSLVDRDQFQLNKYDLDFEQKPNQTNLNIKTSEFEKRRHSGDLTTQRSMFDVKQREALRRIGETKTRLETIYAKQRQLNTSVAVAEQDRRANHLMSKMTDIENRRSQLFNQYVRDKTDENAIETTNKAKTRHTELEVKNREDQLRNLEKVINKNEEIEYELRKSVKEAEFQRRKKEQEVQRLKDDLVRKKRVDAKKIRDAIARSEQEERQIERHLAKEKAKLEKLQTRREGHHLRLTNQKEQIKENKALLGIHEREHERLLNVQAQAQSSQSLNTI